jgi:ABC-2 type transport system permease protein
MPRRLANIYRLGIKELWSLRRDPIMILLIVYSFTAAVYIAATVVPETLYNAPIAVVDEDKSTLSERIRLAFYPPRFTEAALITLPEMDHGLDAGAYTFVIDIPPHFERDVLYGRSPRAQVNIDATRMSQAYYGDGVVQQILVGEVQEFVKRYRGDSAGARASLVATALPVDVAWRNRFNPELEKIWFGSIIEMINQTTMLTIILTGAALIREREHGTVEHLLVMPGTPTEIMLAKVWSMALVVLVAVIGSLFVVVHGVLHVPLQGSVALFLAGVVLHLFAATSMGILLATQVRNMPQLGLLIMLIMIPLILLSGGVTPRESMPKVVQDLMLFSPTTHFVELGKIILYRGGGIQSVWPQFLWLLGIGSVFFAIALRRFRKALTA